MRRSTVLLVFVLALVFVMPVFAASGDVKLTIFDATTSTTVCVATPTHACANVAFVSGHYYSFTVQEASNQASAALKVQVSATSAIWSNRTWAWGVTGGANPCVVTDSTSAWQITCSATTNRILYAALQGQASSVTDGNGRATVVLSPLPSSNVEFSYATP